MAKRKRLIPRPKGDGGYVNCGCRDCFEIAIGQPGELCHGCETAGCEAPEWDGVRGEWIHHGECCQEPDCDGDSEDFLTPECGDAAGHDS